MAGWRDTDRPIRPATVIEERAVISHIKRLMHFRIGIADIPGRHGDSASLIGNYTSEARALEGMAHIGAKEGFRDWPDGFRLFDLEVDHDYFREGFRTENGEDIAIAGDSSGLVGNDEGLEQWGGYELEDEPPDNRPEDYPDEPEFQYPLWELIHCKISERNPQYYGDMGFKLVGLYTSLARAKAAAERLRDKPGFRDWPGGWRIDGSGIDEDYGQSGFVLV